MTTKKCPKCGYETTSSSELCPNCGYQLDTAASNMQNNIKQRTFLQKRMISLAIPIGIVAMVLAVIGLVNNNYDIAKSFPQWVSMAYGLSNIIVIIYLVVMLIWFGYLAKGCSKNKAMKSISLIAIIGIVVWLLGLSINSILSYNIFLKGIIKAGLHNGLNITNICILLGMFLLGITYIAISKYFNNRIKVYSLLTGGALVLYIVVYVAVAYVATIIFGLSPEYLNIGLKLISYILILYYLFNALFFFGFSKTNKS